MRNVRLLLVIALAINLVTLTGCDAGGTIAPQYISGTVATGAAVEHATVIVVGSNGARFYVSITNSAGFYQANVSGLRLPALITATSTSSAPLFSFATVSDINATVNVTPATTLATLLLTGSANPTSPAQLGAASASTLVRLFHQFLGNAAPILTACGVPTSCDPRTTPFSANHTGIDAFYDLVNFGAPDANGIVTLTNRVNGEQVAVNTRTGQTSGAFSTDPATSQACQEIQAIQQQLDTWASYYATAPAAPQNQDLRALFDPAFFDCGRTLDEMLNDMNDPAFIGMQIKQLSLTNWDGPTSVTANFTLALANGASTACSMRMINNGGRWLIRGNQRLVSFACSAAGFANLFDNDGISSQLQFDFNAYRSAATDAITSLSITGPGLGQGLTLPSSALANGEIPGQRQAEAYQALDDASVASLPATTLTYTYTLKDAQGLTLGEGTASLPARPLSPSEIREQIPVLTQPSRATLAAYNGGPLTVAWQPQNALTDTLGLRLADIDLYRISRSLVEWHNDKSAITRPSPTSAVTSISKISSSDVTNFSNRLTIWWADQHGRRVCRTGFR